MEPLGLLQSKEEPEVVLRMIGTDGPCSVDLYSLYKDSDTVGLFADCRDMPRLFVHVALAALQTNHVIALGMLEKIPEEVYDLPTPPPHHTEFLQAMNLKIILLVEGDDLGGALYELQRRSEIISGWLGSSSLELAHNLHRLGCLNSALGRHEECVEALKQSLIVGGSHDEYDSLDSITLLAVPYAAMNENGKTLLLVYNLFPIIHLFTLLCTCRPSHTPVRVCTVHGGGFQ